MDTLILIIKLVPLVIILLSFIRLPLSIACFIIYQILVPWLNFNFLGVNVSYNFIYLIFLISFLIQRKSDKPLKYDILKPFFFYFIASFVLMLFQTKLSLSVQFSNWRTEIMSTMILPFIMINMAEYDNKIIKYATNSLVIASLIAGLYALFLLTLPRGLNPYLMSLAPAFGEEYHIEYADDAGRALSRIFSTFSHPLPWCFYLCMSILFFATIAKDFKNKYLLYVIIGISFINLIFCGVRSGIAAMTIPASYLLFKYKNFTALKYVTISFIIIAILIFSNQALYDTVFSMFDTSGRVETKGSDMEMRLYQLEGCFDSIRGHELFGNGYRWTTYYNATFGNHPKAYTFESLIFVILCNSGYVGFILWTIFIFLICKAIHTFSLNKENSYWLNSFLFLYLSFTIVTGEYYLMKWFIFFYTITFLVTNNTKYSKYNLWKS